MSGINAINQILDHIVQGGKTILKDRYISREKVPSFASKRVQSINMESVIHDGHQHQHVKRSYFSLVKDNQPKNIKKDGGGPTRLNIEKQKKINPKTTRPQKKKYNHRSFSYSGFKEGKLNSAGYNAVRLDPAWKQKENCFVKLSDDDKNRVVVERVKLRESMQDDRLRGQKQKQKLKQYEQKLANEIFQKQRIQRKNTKQKLLNQHIVKGEDHSFYFNDQGEAILFKVNKNKRTQNKIVSANQKQYKFNLQEERIIQQPHLNSKRLYLSTKNFQSTKNMNSVTNPIEHQRIQSAKGEAFASAVLKTVNLSRIYMNQSLRQLRVQEFMKRNDLFNNNHTRQTTSIPYLQTKPGSVYTQLSTNQVVGNQSREKINESRRLSKDNSKTYSKKKNHFELFSNNQPNPTNITQRNYDRLERNNDFDTRKIIARSVKTAQQYSRRGSLSDCRPYSCVKRDKITTLNEQLVIALIQ